MKHCQAPVGSVSCYLSLVVTMSKSCALGYGQGTKGCPSKRYRQHGHDHSANHAAVTHIDTEALTPRGDRCAFGGTR
jgi:hypothetical protein